MVKPNSISSKMNTTILHRTTLLMMMVVTIKAVIRSRLGTKMLPCIVTHIKTSLTKRKWLATSIGTLKSKIIYTTLTHILTLMSLRVTCIQTLSLSTLSHLQTRSTCANQAHAATTSFKSKMNNFNMPIRPVTLRITVIMLEMKHFHLGDTALKIPPVTNNRSSNSKVVQTKSYMIIIDARWERNFDDFLLKTYFK